MPLPYKTLIIDDENLARLRLKRILSDYKVHFEVIGEAANGNQAFEMIERLKPDLIFLDIQMPGKNVFEMLAEIVHQPSVIFCTAYEDYALQAFENFSIDYLLKPVEKKRLEVTISKLKHLHKQQSISELIKKFSTLHEEKYPVSIAHKCGDKIIMVKLSEITYFKADNNYVSFYNTDSKEYLTTQTLQSLEDSLPSDFLRISKSVMVNCNYVKELHKYFRGKFIIKLNDLNCTSLESGAFYREKILSNFNL